MIHSLHTQNHRILLVTSQPDSLMPMAAVMSTILQQYPETIRPYEVMSALDVQNVDLLIMDTHHQEDSLHLIRSIKEGFSALPLIAMVPYGDVNMVERVIALGADDYISQPISLERLKVTLRNALRLRNLLRDNTSADMLKSGHPLSPLLDSMGKLKTLREVEDAVIEFAIANCDGCITQAARALGIGRSTLYRKMQEKIDTTTQAKVVLNH